MTIDKKYSVLLADDHILVREAIADMLVKLEDFIIFRKVGNGKEVLECLNGRSKPDIVILDLNMPVMDGFDCAREIAKKHPGLKVVILTMFDSEIAMIRLLQHGVRGFIKKDITPRELKNALLQVIEGSGYYYSNETTGKLGNMIHQHYINNTPLEQSLLTEREIEFLRYACTDLTYKEIATAMKLTPRMVDCCRDTLFEKLDVKNRVALAIYAMRHGLVMVN